MSMFFRVFVSLGLLALGYYVGREIGRGEPIRRDLQGLRDQDARDATSPETQVQPPPADHSKE